MGDTNSESVPEGIAIVGMGGRFPGARDVDGFWHNLVHGVDCVSQFSEEELEYSVAANCGASQGQKVVRARSVIEDADLFDAEFFGMYPREAEVTDPQHRLFLECAWETMERAGYSPDSYPGLIGVYAGLAMNTYLLHNLCTDREFAANFSANYQVGNYQVMLGNDKDFLPTRVSYKLNLRGPSISIQTACSTSLVAICQACTSLMTFQCDMALAGGVSITFPQKRDYLYQEQAMVSADGTCRTFDAKACGTVFGHGLGMVLLKRLEDAMADGDTILSVIKGWALNNDGSDKVGYAAPNLKAQADVIAMAQAAAGVHPDTISYVEAHGTATPIGDPIEVAALTDAFRRGGSSRTQYCALGTAKTHIGHLDVASGAVGLIKTVLQLQNEFIPALLHFESPNPKIDFVNSPFFPVAQPEEWKRGTSPRRAGVSAFGVGGTNAHVVLEEAPLAAPSSESRRRQLLLLSAKSEKALHNMSERLAVRLEANPELPLADVAFTLHRGRQRFKHRRALCAGSAEEAVERLRKPDSKQTFIGRAPDRPPTITFLFPGQGSQYVNMGRELYETEPVYRESVDLCAGLLQHHLHLDVRSVLYPETEVASDAKWRINQTCVTQPVVFIVEYALARLWMNFGIKPSLLIGHSVGEYVAAVLAEVFTLEEALSLLAARARLMQDLPSGSMLAVRQGVAELDGLLPEDVAVAAVNSSSLITLSGPTSALLAIQETLESKNILCRLLSTSHAFHSSMMDPIVAPFTELVQKVAQQPPKLPWISSLTGTWVDAQLAPEASYWGEQLRQTVRFDQSIDTAVQHGANVFVEVGPGQALTQFVRQHSSKPDELTLLSSLGPNDANPADLESILVSLGRLWLHGLEPDWQSFYARERRHRIPLPTYPFERKRYWIEAPPRTGSHAPAEVIPLQDSPPHSNGDGPLLVPNNVRQEAVPRPVLENARPSARPLIEKQIQLMRQQLEIIRSGSMRK